jgi:cobalt-zinc-cadmium resistance protein CzcA
MLRRVVDFSLDNRWIVLSLAVAVIAFGLYTMWNIPIEAFPDLTNTQVDVTVEAPGMSPTEVEQLVTFPLETALMGIPHMQTVRSISKLGLSMITVVFDDYIDIFLARQLVNERIGEAQGRIPAGLQPVMGPLASVFGEAFQFTLQSSTRTLMELKTLLDWRLRFDLRAVQGVSEVNSWGGETKQYIIEIDPNALLRYNLTLHDVFTRVTENNENFGGGFIEHAEQQYTILGLGRASSEHDLANIVVLSQNGVPVLLGDLAKIKVAPMPRQGAVMHDAKGEAVAGMVILLKGADARRVIQSVKAKIGSLRLPPGVTLTSFYDQSQVIDGTLHTVEHNLIEAGILVIAVLLLFLGDLRAAFIVALVIPLSMLVGFIGMSLFGVSANLMSLGAIDFGMIVDGSVVMVEYFVRRLADPGQGDSKKRIREAAYEVARPILFAVIIIIAVYIPIFTLQGMESRMFRPMAITVCSALVGSLLFALTLVPALSSLILKVRSSTENRGGESESAWFIGLRVRYRHSLDWVIAHRVTVIAAAGVLLAVALGSLHYIGTEFMPRLDEGSIVVTSRRLPGISLTESISLGKQIERVIMSFPEIRGVVTKLGRPDLATEAMGIYESDSYLTLNPQGTWKCCQSKEELIGKLSTALSAIPGVAYEFTQPMEMRMDEALTGIRGDVAIKIFGDDINTLQDLARQVLSVISTVPGAFNPQMEQTSGVPELQIEINRDEMARYGLNVSDVQEMIETLVGGTQVSEMIIGQQRFAIALRLPETQRNDLDKLGNLLLHASGGELVRLNQIADLNVVSSPEMITREDARRRIVVQTDVRGTDLGSFVAAAQAKVAAAVNLPFGYSMVWGGQFENQQRADRRLALVLPVSIALIFGLLFASFENLGQTFLILLIVPFALVGGIGALWLRGINLNLSASIGFIALFGVAVLNGVVMVSHINLLRSQGLAVDRAVRIGASDRLRPVMMTALVASLGFIPMAMATSTGAEVQRPLATVVIGGLITATILTLYLLPLFYPWFSPPDPPELRQQSQMANV